MYKITLATVIFRSPLLAGAGDGIGHCLLRLLTAACGTKRHFVATHQFGRYRRSSGHRAKLLLAWFDAIDPKPSDFNTPICGGGRKYADLLAPQDYAVRIHCPVEGAHRQRPTAWLGM